MFCDTMSRRCCVAIMSLAAAWFSWFIGRNGNRLPLAPSQLVLSNLISRGGMSAGSRFNSVLNRELNPAQSETCSCRYC